jgi:hypothetical protein
LISVAEITAVKFDTAFEHKQDVQCIGHQVGCYETGGLPQPEIAKPDAFRNRVNFQIKQLHKNIILGQGRKDENRQQVEDDYIRRKGHSSAEGIFQELNTRVILFQQNFF